MSEQVWLCVWTNTRWIPFVLLILLEHRESVCGNSSSRNNKTETPIPFFLGRERVESVRLIDNQVERTHVWKRCANYGIVAVGMRCQCLSSHVCEWMSVSWRGWIVCSTSGVCYSALSFLLHHLYNPDPKTNTKSFFPSQSYNKNDQKTFSNRSLSFCTCLILSETAGTLYLRGTLNNLWQRKFLPHHMATLGAKHWKKRWALREAIGDWRLAIEWRVREMCVREMCERDRDGDLSLGGTQCERWWPWSNKLMQLTTRTWLHVAFSNCNKHEQCDFNTWFIWRAMTSRVGVGWRWWWW